MVLAVCENGCKADGFLRIEISFAATCIYIAYLGKRNSNQPIDSQIMVYVTFVVLIKALENQKCSDRMC